MTVPSNDEILFLALGGAGEIGMNLNLYGHAGKWLMLDLGIAFGDDTMPGVEVIMPDPTFIEERRRDLVGIVDWLAVEVANDQVFGRHFFTLYSLAVSEKEATESDLKVHATSTDYVFSIFGVIDTNKVWVRLNN